LTFSINIIFDFGTEHDILLEPDVPFQDPLDHFVDQFLEDDEKGGYVVQVDE